MRGIGHLWLNDWSEGLGKEAVCKLGQAGPGRDVLGVMGYKTLALDKPKQGRYRFPGMVSSGRNCYLGDGVVSPRGPSSCSSLWQ